MLAEWERQRAVQLTWPHCNSDWADMLPAVERVYREMARQIASREQLIVVADPCCQLPEKLKADVCRIATNDTWARDHAFLTVDEDGRRLLLDFCFNGWGEKFPAEKDNAINRQLYHQLLSPDDNLLWGEYESHLDFVLEGGSIESDGQGTIFTTQHCLMAPHRNQPLERIEIEMRLKQWLGAERVVWLQNGYLEGDDTDGHIDTLVRVAPNNTLLYIAPPASSDPHHDALCALEQELRRLETLQGEPYRLLALPLPRPICDVGDGSGGNSQRLPATYANYLVINDAVLVPTYGQPDLDAQAMLIISEAFPDREMVGIDCCPLIHQHGSLHCSTMQYY